MSYKQFALMTLFALPLSASSVTGCASDSTSSEFTNQRDDSVVGGTAEDGYPAAGFLYFRKDTSGSIYGPSCGATLIAPRVAVTAAHCTKAGTESGAISFGIGFGQLNDNKWFDAASIVEHPSFNPDSWWHRYRHDIALLILTKEVENISPTIIAAPEEGDVVHYVGYGRTEEGDYEDSASGTPGQRKGADQTVEDSNAYSIWTKGIDGGLCWGDSGGPILKDQFIYGVLADFADEFECEVGNEMIFTSLSGELSSFIEPTLANYGLSLSSLEEEEVCHHSECDMGEALVSSCSSCADDVCAVDSYCCSTEWDAVCVDEAVTYCSNTCVYSECAHSECETGSAQDSTCSACSMAVCDYDEYCCTTEWDDQCVDEAYYFCVCE